MATLTTSRSPPTWILNLPARPQVDGQDLADDARVAGSMNAAGVWRRDDAGWLRWTDRDGSLWLRALLPAPKHLRIVGGPAQKLVIASGPHEGRTYVGGDERGFERLIIPAEQRDSANAWYRLGTPALLGPEFDRTPHWGRVEIEPAARAKTTVFVTVLITDSADATQPPSGEVEVADDGIVVTLRGTWPPKAAAMPPGADPSRAREETAVLRLGAGTQCGGSVEVTGTEPLCWTLPTEVVPDEPLKTVSP